MSDLDLIWEHRQEDLVRRIDPYWDAIRSFVTGVQGRNPDALDLFTENATNLVYAAHTKGSPSLIVRVHIAAKPWFEAETQAIDLAKMAGVPVPHVRRIKHIHGDNEVVSICIQDMLPGTPLYKLLSSHRITNDSVAAVIKQSVTSCDDFIPPNLVSSSATKRIGSRSIQTWFAATTSRLAKP